MLWLTLISVAVVVTLFVVSAWSTDLDNWGLPSEEDDHG